jgi:hypothetical protein
MLTGSLAVLNGIVGGFGVVVALTVGGVDRGRVVVKPMTLSFRSGEGEAER